MSVDGQELVQRWHALTGTEVDEATYRALQPTLPNAQTIEVWYADREEPQRITFYQTPQFWLLKKLARSLDCGLGRSELSIPAPL